MSLCRFTSEGTIKLLKGWARPEAYEAWLALLPAGAYETIVRSMNSRIDRMDVVRAQYVVCESADKWWDEYEIISGCRHWHMSLDKGRSRSSCGPPPTSSTIAP
jgi:hypothetical protein